MAKPSPSLYSIAKTFIWFAVIGILLTGSLVAIVWLDHSREWKGWQKKFIRLKLEKTRDELRQTDESLDKQKLEGLKKDLAQSHAKRHAQESGTRRLEKELDALNSKIVKVRMKSQDLKQYQDSYKYFLEEYRLHGDPRAADVEKKLNALTPSLNRVKSDLESLEKEKETKEARLQSLFSAQKELQKELEKLLEAKKRLEKRVENLKPSLAKEILNAPMLDFLAPSLRVQQVVLEDLYDDYHFAKVQKVDRCMTCHLGIDQKGFEKAPQPFRTHPNLELYLGSASPHPVEKFGCTVCHGGNGHSVGFKDAAHTPTTEAQAREWRQKYHWEELEKWDAKMLSSHHVQASCAKCHRDVVEVPKADRLNKGRKIAEASGCFNCHKIEGFAPNWKTGPGLEHVQSKLEKDWIVRWLKDPKAFRPSTPMPRIFHLSNTSSPEDRDKNDAAIEAIAAYLLKNSDPVSLKTPPVAGDPERGEKLVKELGCLACHAAAGTQASHFGPELSNLGSKVTPEWLYSWLKDPKHYSAGTRMPNLRLTDEEAADITRYLLLQNAPAFEKDPIPAVKPEVRDEMILSFLQGNLRLSEAQAELSQMNEEQKLEFLGKKSIAHQGCFACHAIRGFEDAKPIGAELTNEGRKDIHQFDFGFIPIERSRNAWIEQKLKDPRIFDKGKIKAYHEKLRMPHFEFTEDEIGALTTFILSLSEESVPLQMQKRLNLKEVEIEKGRLLISKLNCTGCHTFDGKNGTLREIAEDPGAAPPILDGEGLKVQEKWLHGFLKDPGAIRIRPWLTTRMPTFDFTKEELDTLIHTFDYLAKEELPYHGFEIPESSPEKIREGQVLVEKLQCMKCHEVNASSTAMGTSFLAPNLTLTKTRLKPAWVKEWLKDPQVLEPGTMMPTFFPEGQSPLPDILGGDAEQQIEAIRDYLYRYETESNTR